MTFVCIYMGRADECPECGGYNITGTKFCSHECADSYDQRQQENAALMQARRDEEDAFGREVARLRALGHSYEECDRIMATSAL